MPTYFKIYYQINDLKHYDMLLCFTVMNDISNFWFGGFPKFLSIIKTETGSLCGNGTRTYHRFPMEKMVTGNCFLHAPGLYLSEGNL